MCRSIPCLLPGELYQYQSLVWAWSMLLSGHCWKYTIILIKMKEMFQHLHLYQSFFTVRNKSISHQSFWLAFNIQYALVVKEYPLMWCHLCSRLIWYLFYPKCKSRSQNSNMIHRLIRKKLHVNFLLLYFTKKGQCQNICFLIGPYFMDAFTDWLLN